MLFSRKDNEPGTAHMVFEAILGVVLGAAIAAVWLMLKPVAIADAPKKTEPGAVAERHAVEFINGREGPVRQAQWQAKRKAFLAGDERGVELQEQDLNRWFAVQFANLDLTKKWDSFGVEYHGGLPVFRFDGSDVEVGLVNELAMSKDWKRKFVIQARGAFESRGGNYVFVPNTMYVGSCPIPFARVRQSIVDRLVEPFALPEEEAKAWKAIRDVRVEQSRLKVGFSPPPPAVAPTIEVHRAEEAAPPAAVVDTPAEATAAAETTESTDGPVGPAEVAPQPAPEGTTESVPTSEPAPADEVAAPAETPAPTVTEPTPPGA